MKNEKLYRAKNIKIGLIAGYENDYYIDIYQSNGSWQTIATGSLKYVKSYINKVIFI
jgi:hypothetical protein